MEGRSVSAVHYFQVSVAVEVGIPAAIMLEQIEFWCKKNKANGVHLHDGLYWTYNTVKAFHEIYPYMSERTIRSALKKLEDDELIKTGNFNDDPYVRTKWYALTAKGTDLLNGIPWQERRMHLPETANGIGKKVKSHNYINSYLPVSKTLNEGGDASEEESLVEPSSEYNLQVSSGFVPPTLEEVKDFFATNMLDQSDAEDFWLHYQSQGWVRGNNIPVSDWHALAVSWNRRQKLDRTSDRKPKSSYDMSEFSIEHWERG